MRCWAASDWCARPPSSACCPPALSSTRRRLPRRRAHRAVAGRHHHPGRRRRRRCSTPSPASVTSKTNRSGPAGLPTTRGTAGTQTWPPADVTNTVARFLYSLFHVRWMKNQIAQWGPFYSPHLLTSLNMPHLAGMSKAVTAAVPTASWRVSLRSKHLFLDRSMLKAVSAATDSGPHRPEHPRRYS